MTTAASFKFFPAPAPLAPFVEYLYVSDVPCGFVDRVQAIRLPELQAQLVFAIEEGGEFPGGWRLGQGRRACLFLQPAHLQMVPIAGTIRHAVGASLRAAGLRLLLPKGSGDFTDTALIPLEDVVGREARNLGERLVAEPIADRRCAILRDYLLARAEGVTLPSRSVVRALQLIGQSHGRVSTEQVAQACGCSSRALRTAALAETGLTPKQLARVVRIRRAVDLLNANRVALTETALAAAFADHAHMSREFRELIGVTPSQLHQRIHGALPTHTAERNLMSTGLLIAPKAGP